MLENPYVLVEYKSWICQMILIAVIDITRTANTLPPNRPKKRSSTTLSSKTFILNVHQCWLHNSKYSIQVNLNLNLNRFFFDELASHLLSSCRLFSVGGKSTWVPGPKSCLSTWRIIQVNGKWLGSPPSISHLHSQFGRGPTTRSLGDENDHHGY